MASGVACPGAGPAGLRMKTLVRNLGSIAGACLFVAAIVVFHRELKGYSYHDVVAELRSMPAKSWLFAAVLTFLNYLTLTASDSLALRYIGHRIAYRKLALASFIGYAFSHNTTIVGGSAARYRIYSFLGLSAAEVATLVVFCGFTFWLGFLTLAGAAFILVPQHIPQALHLPFASVWPVGVVFLILAGSYVLATSLKRRPLHFRNWEFSLPSARLSLGQIGISALDWTLAASVLYVLLPREASLTYPHFLGVFMVAQALGLLSYVPGGLGVFDTVIVVLLADFMETSGLVGSLLLYRLIYYLLPLTAASVMLASTRTPAPQGARQTIRPGAGPVGHGDRAAPVRSRRLCGRRHSPVLRGPPRGPRSNRVAARPASFARRGNLPLPRQSHRRRTSPAGPGSAAPPRRRLPPHRRPPGRRHRFLPAQRPGLRGSDHPCGDAAGVAAVPAAVPSEGLADHAAFHPRLDRADRRDAAVGRLAGAVLLQTRRVLA